MPSIRLHNKDTEEHAIQEQSGIVSTLPTRDQRDSPKDIGGKVSGRSEANGAHSKSVEL